MKLLIDLGNTRLKWATYHAGTLQPGEAVVYRGRRLCDLLDDVWQQLPPPDAIHLASVVSIALRERLQSWLSARWQVPVRIASSRTAQAGVRSGYTHPAQLGVDRWLALVGAWERFRGAVCVVDCGSALTVDILDRTGQHLGGVIAPGLQLMAQALSAGTDLPDGDGPPITGLGHDTAAAMAAGRYQAALGLVDRCYAQAPEDARLVLTGGDASIIGTGLNIPYELMPDLVLQGLAGTLDGV